MRVAVGLIKWKGRFLVGRRAADGPLPGLDEFPGGKCRADERPEACVVRECFEETGLRVRPRRLRHRVAHEYPHGKLEISFFDCEIDGREVVEPLAPFRWVDLSEVAALRFPEANASLIAELIAEATT